MTTSDGYILRLFRIPNGLNGTFIEGRPAVLLQHGLYELSDCYIIRGTNLSLGFYLANQGYDVWAANTRGNLYSRNHTTLDPNTSPEFWDFSFPELINDHQANIEYILNQTGLDSISLIAMSAGGTSMFMSLFNQNEWFSRRLNLFISMSQLTRLDNIVGFPAIGLNSSLPWHILRQMNINELSNYNSLARGMQFLM